jgi:2-oxoglutarate dehydrogenase E1 component
VGIGPAKLRDIVALLEQTYCQSIGVEFRYIRTPEKVKWLQQRMESVRNTPDFSIDQKKEILEKLNEAVVFETLPRQEVHRRQALQHRRCRSPHPRAGHRDRARCRAGHHRIRHRHGPPRPPQRAGQHLRKSYDQIFSEFEGKDYEDQLVEGDVKYHMGYSSMLKTNSGKDVRLTLGPQPQPLGNAWAP